MGGISASCCDPTSRKPTAAGIVTGRLWRYPQPPTLLGIPRSRRRVVPGLPASDRALRYPIGATSIGRESAMSDLVVLDFDGVGTAAGGLAGAGFGALSGSLADYGINDEFIKNLGKTIPKGSSALFTLIKSSTPDKVLPELERFKPRVLKTSLSRAQEDKLRAALHKTAAAA